MARIVSTAVPETYYAVNGDFHLAYQTLGEGPEARDTQSFAGRAKLSACHLGSKPVAW
jgi:hypothetical protein